MRSIDFPADDLARLGMLDLRAVGPIGPRMQISRFYFDLLAPAARADVMRCRVQVVDDPWCRGP